jgi:outer membrane receptor protein involved in Fe transport
MEAGGKISFSRFDNEVSVAKQTAGRWIQDTSLSAKYHLAENIGAVYASFTLNAGRQTTITAGLRYEYTFSSLGTAQKDNLLYSYYGEFFPTFQFSRKINADHSVNFSYSRRITRPGFNDLAPFTIFFDPKTFYSGNPALQPAIANSVQAGYGYRSYNFSVGYTHEIHTIDNFYFQTHRIDTVTGIVYLSAKNFNYQNYLTVSLSLPLKISTWWTMQNNVALNWRSVNTTSEESDISLNYPDYSLSTTQRFVFTGDYAAELTAIYSSAGYFGTAKRQPLYQISAGLQKKLKGDRDVLRFIANDVFNSGGYYQFGEMLPVSGAIVNRTFDFANMSFRFSFTHHFGKNGLADKKQRAIGADEELKRVHN